MTAVRVDEEYRPSRRLKGFWLGAAIVVAGAAAVIVTGAKTSDRAVVEAMLVQDIPSLKAWALAAPEDYQQVIAAETAALRAGVPAAQRHAQRDRTVRMATSAKLSHGDDGLVLRHLRLTLEAGLALAEAAPALCVRLHEEGADGDVERALPADLRMPWLRQQAAVMRVPLTGRASLATPDEEVAAFSAASDQAAKRLGLSSDAFMARMLGRGDAKSVCAAHNALIEALLDGGTPQVVARIYRRHASEVGEDYLPASGDMNASAPGPSGQPSAIQPSSNPVPAMRNATE
ncbi:MAG: hypothetical protein INF91_06995 [Alphaproteobacteria bacterium]|nr:hypothetical protein [Alphaproteobacteria bacterium]